MAQRQFVTGRRSCMLWLIIVLVLVLAVSLTTVVFVIGPERQLATQVTATARAYASEVQRAYDAGVAFAAAGDWDKAVEEFARVVRLEPGYRDAAARLTDARAKADVAKDKTATAQAQAAATAQAQTMATAQAQATATVQAQMATTAQAQVAATVQAQVAATAQAQAIATAQAQATATVQVQATAVSKQATATAQAQSRERDITRYDWVKRNPSGSPPDMGNYGLAYDSRRNVFVLFGGDGETWEWNGNNWTKIQVSVAPSQRGNPAMAYDSRRGVIVLFGGLDNQRRPLNDTWEYDGHSWRQIGQRLAPAPRREPCVTYDEAREVIVLFGGNDPNTTFGDTWTYDGNSWIQQAPTRSPSPRALCAMAYDSGRVTVVLFGGATVEGWAGSSAFDDTWEWDGSNWIERTPTVRPPARGGHALVYHDRLGVTLAFGGDKGACTILYEDTWAWDGNTWQPLPTSNPGTHSVIASAYGPLENTVLLFGGWAGGNSICRVTSETWEFILK